ncbi:MAG: peptidoglycan-binding domain-containing protein [Alphaproteobacteria bacterium]|jgi:hypothetical protein|nr:peptidoglycan-binding domain-containing protein [Alphaproteobacteria bacterium]
MRRPHAGPALGTLGRHAAGLCLAFVLVALLAPPLAATPPARRNFVVDWPAALSAAQAFDPADAKRFEAEVEKLLQRSGFPILTPPAPFVAFGRDSADYLFFNALIELFKPALRRRQTARVERFIAAFNQGRLGYVMLSSHSFSGCLALRLGLEISDGTGRDQGRAIGRGEYLLAIGAKPRPPKWCRFHDRYRSHLGETWYRATGIAAPVDAVLSGKGIADVQRALARLGYDPGKADGLLGPRTRRAIEAYQRKQGRTADGRPTLGLLDALRDSVARAGK